MSEATSLVLESTCQTCRCQRRWHYQTYAGDAGTINPIPCACTGFMMTEAPSLIKIHQHEMSKRLFRAAVARQDAVDGAKYRKSLDEATDAQPPRGEG
jgi:hypothetical protein